MAIYGLITAIVLAGLIEVFVVVFISCLKLAGYSVSGFEVMNGWMVEVTVILSASVGN